LFTLLPLYICRCCLFAHLESKILKHVVCEYHTLSQQHTTFTNLGKLDLIQKRWLCVYSSSKVVVVIRQSLDMRNHAVNAFFFLIQEWSKQLFHKSESHTSSKQKLTYNSVLLLGKWLQVSITIYIWYAIFLIWLEMSSYILHHCQI